MKLKLLLNISKNDPHNLYSSICSKQLHTPEDSTQMPVFPGLPRPNYLHASRPVSTWGLCCNAYHTAWHLLVSCSQGVTAPYSVEHLKTRISTWLFSVYPRFFKVHLVSLALSSHGSPNHQSSSTSLPYSWTMVSKTWPLLLRRPQTSRENGHINRRPYNML